MALEVELKFPLADRVQMEQHLHELQAEREAEIRHVDRYFNHPGRDFAETDEALRIRTAGSSCRITYKGPVLDPRVKTRREIELPVGTAASDADQLAELLLALGFREVRAVAKTRTPWSLTWDDREAEVVLDQVEGLGDFVELELLAEDSDRDAAQESVLRLAERLGLEQPAERRSYLQLLLEQDSAG
jgi:adenylate cyclase, class 2